MTEAEATVFGKAFGNPTRQRILRYCCCNRRSVGNIAAHCKVTQPTASHHLALLERAGLVIREPEGKEVFYEVDQSRLVSCCGQLLFTLAPDEEGTKALKNCKC